LVAKLFDHEFEFLDVRGRWEGRDGLGNWSGGQKGGRGVSGKTCIRHARGGVKGSCERSWRKIGFRSEGRISFLLKLLVDLAALIVGWVIASTEYAFDVLGAVLARAEMSRVGASAFDAPGLKMAVVPGMAIPLTIHALSYVAFRLGGLKCDPALL
jgi:hypothetical protein